MAFPSPEKRPVTVQLVLVTCHFAGYSYLSTITCHSYRLQQPQACQLGVWLCGDIVVDVEPGSPHWYHQGPAWGPTIIIMMIAMHCQDCDAY